MSSLDPFGSRTSRNTFLDHQGRLLFTLADENQRCADPLLNALLGLGDTLHIPGRELRLTEGSDISEIRLGNLALERI